MLKESTDGGPENILYFQARKQSLIGINLTSTQACSSGERESLATLDVPIVDPAQDHQQLFGSDFDTSHPGVALRYLIGPLFKPSVPDRQAITIPVEDLHLVASSIDE
jgi:hypothetical protein